MGRGGYRLGLQEETVLEGGGGYRLGPVVRT